MKYLEYYLVRLRKYCLWGVGLLLLCFSCLAEDDSVIKKYLFMGHIYQWSVPGDNRIDYRLEGFNFGKYDQIWLGGDLCTRTNEDPKTLAYLDSIFNLSSPSTLWTLGNHDFKHGPLSQIERFTKRKSFYSQFRNGINLVVLNTNEYHHMNYQPKPEECFLLDAQIELLEKLADTIQIASHLVILHHHALLTNNLSNNSIDMGKIFNKYTEDLRIDCANQFTFENKIYPLLEKVREKGIQVILVSGDLGQRSKAFEYQTSEGIWFLGSGINNSVGAKTPAYVTDTSPDKVLVFQHDIKQRKLTWKFELLKDVLE